MNPRDLSQADAVNADLHLENQIRAENDMAAVANLAMRAVIEKHKRMTVAEIRALERVAQQVMQELRAYEKSAFSLSDLYGACQSAGVELDDFGGDPAAFLGDDPRDRVAFQVALAQFAPLYAQAILNAAMWNESSSCYWWDRNEIARRAA